MKHRLTVVMTSYNIEKFLPRFFECFSKQTYTDFCLLVVDDGSTDNSVAVIKKYAEKDERIKLVESEHLGLPGIKNYALSLIDTELFAFADGDDIIGPDYLKHLVDKLDEYNADLVISRVEYLREDDLKRYNVQTPYEERYIERDNFKEKLPPLLRDRRLNYFYAKVYRTKYLEGIEIDDGFTHGEDTVFVFKYIVKINSLVLIDDVDYSYIKYNTRSVTAYRGDDVYERFLKVNLFLLDFTRENGLFSEEMLHIIDGRTLVIGNWAIEKILGSDSSKKEKNDQISKVLSNTYYSRAYERQEENLNILRFNYIPPQNGKKYHNKYRFDEKKRKVKDKILYLAPKPLHSLNKKRIENKERRINNRIKKGC